MVGDDRACGMRDYDCRCGVLEPMVPILYRDRYPF